MEVSRRKLPHWRLQGATYFVTFRLRHGTLTIEEVCLALEQIRSGDTVYYELLAATVMPDHVHLLLTPVGDIDLSRITKGVKGVTANRINRLRGARGALWQDESYDRVVRDEAELHEKLRYTLHNPVKEGVAEDGWAWAGFFCKVDTA